MATARGNGRPGGDRHINQRARRIVAVMALVALALAGAPSASSAKAASFSLRAAPATVRMSAGGTASVELIVTRSSGFRGRINFSVVGLASGVSISASSPTRRGLLVTLSAASTAASALVPVRVVGKGGGLTRETIFSLEVVAATPPPTTTPLTTTTTSPVTPLPPSAGDYSLSIDPTTVSVQAGTTIRYAIFVNSTGGFNSTVRFELKGLPPGSRAAFLPEFAKYGTSLIVATSSGTPKGEYTLTVNAIDGTRVRSVSTIISVRTGADFSLTLQPNATSVLPGGDVFLTVLVAPITPAAADVDLVLSGVPTGTVLNQSSVRTGSSTVFVLRIPTTTTAGVYRITVRGTSGSFERSASFDLTVGSAISLSLSPTTASVVRGGTATFSLGVSSTGGVPVALAISQLPPSSNGVLVFNSDGTRSLLITTSSTTPIGTYNVIVTGLTNGATATTTAQLTVTV